MPVISYENTGAATTRPAQPDTYDLGAVDAEWRRIFLGDQADALQFGIDQGITLGRIAAAILALGAGDTLRIASDGGLEFGSDVRLTRGAANRLDLAAGDILQLLAGALNLSDAAADPAAAGELRRNGADTKVYSGGAVRNLSDIGNVSVEAIQADMEDEGATNPNRFVSAENAHFGPWAVKFWVRATSAPALEISYNVTSVSKVSTGKYDTVVATDFSSGSCTPFASVSGIVPFITSVSSQGAGNVWLFIADNAGTLTDKDWRLMALGDQ